jgi:hypothetical protein
MTGTYAATSVDLGTDTGTIVLTHNSCPAHTDGYWDGTWTSVTHVPNGGEVHVSAAIGGGPVSGRATMTNTDFSTGDLTGTVNCNTVTLSLFSGQVTVNGTFSTDGISIAGTYTAQGTNGTDTGTIQLTFRTCAWLSNGVLDSPGTPRELNGTFTGYVINDNGSLSVETADLDLKVNFSPWSSLSDDTAFTGFATSDNDAPQVDGSVTGYMNCNANTITWQIEPSIMTASGTISADGSSITGNWTGFNVGTVNLSLLP